MLLIIKRKRQRPCRLRFIQIAVAACLLLHMTGITHADLTYDSGSNVVTRACESGAVFNADTERALPVAVALEQNHPNPFNPMTTIKYSLPAEGHVRLTVYNVRGQVVTTLVDRRMGPGMHTTVWDARSAASGVYFYILQTDDFTQTRKMTLLK